MARKLNLLHLSIAIVVSVVVGLVLKKYYPESWWEFAGFVTGVVGVYLVAVEHMINWPVGLVNVVVYGYVFFTGRLFADMSLQVFFFILGVQGWYQWAQGGKKKAPDAGYPVDLEPPSSELKISRIQPIDWAKIVACWVVGTAIYYPVIKHFNGAAPFLDSTLTVGSIIAQLLLNWKKLENWIIWIVVDIIYIPLYISRDFIATAVLYGLLLCLAISGFISWRNTHLGKKKLQPA